MTNKAQIPAFSIIETAVGMVVSAIVIGLIFVIFTIMSERMLDFKNQNLYVSDMNRMTYSFNKDIFDSEKMIVSIDQIAFYSYAGDATKYMIYPDYFLRNKNEFIDTFRIPITKINFDTIQNKSKQSVYLRLSLDIAINKENMKLKFFKKVYSNQLLTKLLQDNEF
jgi:uncharacterized membrane protein required for colicin V production